MRYICSVENVHADCSVLGALESAQARFSFFVMGVHRMTNEPVMASTAPPTLGAAQVFTMALICLGIGLGIGYLMRSSQQAVSLEAGPAHPITQTSAAER